MKRRVVASLVVAFLAVTCAVAIAKRVERERWYVEVPPAEVTLPPDLVGKVSGLQSAAAAADTFVLHAENFDDGTMSPYTAVDFTAQLGPFFHVADVTQLNGGSSGNLIPLSGTKSMWCGTAQSSGVPFCAWAAVPGYGNNWKQILQSAPLGGDSVVVSYKVFWDSEPGYDHTIVEWSHNSGATWTALPVTDTWSSGPDLYDGTGPAPYITEAFGDRITGGDGTVTVRFHFESDGGWSDEDGLWPTDGAVTVDDIALTTWSGPTLVAGDTEDFESATVGALASGIWTAMQSAGFGSYAALYPGFSLLQEGDDCFFVTSVVVGFFADPSVANFACHTPDPRPDVGVVPFGTPDGLYIDNAVVSPVFSNVGYGNDYRLNFLVYRDLPLDNMVFDLWRVRSWIGGCPTIWRGDGFFVPIFGNRWQRVSYFIGPRVNTNADGFQVAVGVVDMCGVWCGVFGTGDCHSHAPLIDEIKVQRIGVSSPQYNVRHLDGLFQDNFSQNGTLTGTARADCATDILPATSVGSITPGDSVSMVIAPVGSAGAGTGPNAYAYVRVKRRPANPALSGAVLGSSQIRKAPQPTAYGTRWPFIGTTSVDGITWSCFRMDTAFTTAGAPVANRFCVDLNDNLFLPGDTIFYFYGADVDNATNSGNEGFFTRSVNGQGNNVVTSDIAAAATSPCECTILPARALTVGRNMLYVDDQDDRGGPGQLYWDSAFDMLRIMSRVDRFDVLAPSSVVDNSLASRVKNNQAQIINVYEHIFWDSGDLSSGLIGDGTGAPEKSNDWGLLFTFLNTGTVGTGPDLYLSGDDLAEEWVTLGGAGATMTRSAYMTFNLVSGSHVAHGEAMSPHMVAASGSSFTHGGVPDEMIAHAGCPVINDFDVLDPTGTSIIDFPYPTSGDGALISKNTTNVQAEQAIVVLAGFSYTSIRDASETPPQSSGLQGVPPVFPPARVEFLRDLLIKMHGVVGLPTGVDPGDGPRYVNALSNNYPNPFNPTTTITYSIKEAGHVSLKIYNAAGQVVRTLVDEVQSPGPEGFTIEWDGKSEAGNSVASGVYFYRMVTKGFTQTRKMVVLK